MARIDGLDRACRSLADGQAVVVANPSPMTYGVVATSPGAVNALKGRPLDQNVGVSLHDEGEWRQVVPCLDLPPHWPARLRILLERRLSLLVPLRSAGPDWIKPAVRNGYLALFDGRWAPLARLWDGFPRLYGSSANRTGRRPSATAADAIDNFGSTAVVVDADALRDTARPHGASTMVRISPDGGLELYRPGIQDAGRDPRDFLRELHAVR